MSKAKELLEVGQDVKPSGEFSHKYIAQNIIGDAVLTVGLHLSVEALKGTASKEEKQKYFSILKKIASNHANEIEKEIKKIK